MRTPSSLRIVAEETGDNLEQILVIYCSLSNCMCAVLRVLCAVCDRKKQQLSKKFSSHWTFRHLFSHLLRYSLREERGSVIHFLSFCHHRPRHIFLSYLYISLSIYLPNLSVNIFGCSSPPLYYIIDPFFLIFLSLFLFLLLRNLTI